MNFVVFVLKTDDIQNELKYNDENIVTKKKVFDWMLSTL